MQHLKYFLANVVCSYLFFETQQEGRAVGRTMGWPAALEEALFVAPSGSESNDGVTNPFVYVGVRHGNTP